MLTKENLQDCQTSALLSKAIYSGEQEFFNQARDLGFNDIRYFDANVGKAAVVSDGNRIFVVFRGTKALDDVIADIQSSPVENRGGVGRIHTGFDAVLSNPDNGFANLLIEVIGAAKSMQSGLHKPLICTGHSLGGALATLLAERMALLKIKGDKDLYISKLVTFGSPRVGDKEFAEFVREEVPNIFRFTNPQDIVPGLPFATQGFAHAGPALVLDGKGATLSTSTANPSTETLQARLKDSGIIPKLIWNGIPTHKMGAYIDNMEVLQENPDLKADAPKEGYFSQLDTRIRFNGLTELADYINRSGDFTYTDWVKMGDQITGLETVETGKKKFQKLTFQTIEDAVAFKHRLESLFFDKSGKPLIDIKADGHSLILDMQISHIHSLGLFSEALAIQSLLKEPFTPAQIRGFSGQPATELLNDKKLPASVRKMIESNITQAKKLGSTRDNFLPFTAGWVSAIAGKPPVLNELGESVKPGEGVRSYTHERSGRQHYQTKADSLQPDPPIFEKLGFQRSSTLAGNRLHAPSFWGNFIKDFGLDRNGLLYFTLHTISDLGRDAALRIMERKPNGAPSIFSTIIENAKSLEIEPKQMLLGPFIAFGKAAKTLFRLGFDEPDYQKAPQPAPTHACTETTLFTMDLDNPGAQIDRPHHKGHVEEKEELVNSVNLSAPPARGRRN